MSTTPSKFKLSSKLKYLKILFNILTILLKFKTQKSWWKRLQRCLITADLKQSRSKIKVAYSVGKWFQKVTAGVDTLITCGIGDEKFIQPNRVTNRPSTKIKKKKQLSSTRLISKKQKGLILETSAQTWREYSMQGFVKKLHRRNQSSNFLRGSIIEGVVLAIQAI